MAKRESDTAYFNRIMVDHQDLVEKYAKHLTGKYAGWMRSSLLAIVAHREAHAKMLADHARSGTPHLP